jgi:uncharacterized protein (TIGR02246 family)
MHPMPTLAEDRDQIRDLYARYCHTIDSGAADAWAASFTDDGEFLAGAGDPIIGRDALRAFAAALPAGSMHHMVTDLAIDVAGANATCQSSVLVTSKGAIVVTGRSVDELHRVEGSWRIARRAFTIDATS